MKNMIEPPASVLSSAPAASAGSRDPASPPPALPKSGVNVADLKQYFHIIVNGYRLVALCFVIALAVTVVDLPRSSGLPRQRHPAFEQRPSPAAAGICARKSKPFRVIMKIPTGVVLSPGPSSRGPAKR